MSHEAVSSAGQPAPYPTAYPTPYPQGGSPVLPGPQGASAPLAGWWRRVGASLLDSLLVMVPYFVGGMIALALMETVPDPLGGTNEQFTPGSGVSLALGLLVALGLVVWNRYFRQGRRGQSLGKQALGIRLVSAREGQPIGAGLAFGRDIAHFLDGVLYIGYLWPLWDPMKQTFADKIVGSVVVRVR
jgi:uncharacterized RDD family membrane protein YckC